MSPMGYSKSPITSAAGTVAANITGTMAHVNNIGGMSTVSSYSCTNPYGLKTAADGVGSGINNAAALSNAATSGMMGIGGGSNNLCSSSSLSINPNVNISGGTLVTGGGAIGVISSNNSNVMGVLPGEGPPTPTQELDISGSSSIDQQQQRKRELF